MCLTPADACCVNTNIYDSVISYKPLLIQLCKYVYLSKTASLRRMECVSDVQSFGMIFFMVVVGPHGSTDSQPFNLIG